VKDFYLKKTGFSRDTFFLEAFIVFHRMVKNNPERHPPARESKAWA
jgi:hypothetical protein